MERLPNEQKDQLIKAAYEQIVSYKASGRATADYSVDVKYWLEAQPGVAKASLRGRNTITVEFEDQTQVGILLDRQEQYGGGRMGKLRPVDANLIPFPEPESLVKWPVWWHRKTPGTKKALLFDPLYDDWPPESTTNQIESALQGAGYSVDKVLGDSANLASLATIENERYGVIFVRSHGAVLVVGGDDKIHVMARPFFDVLPDPAASGFDGVGVFYVGTDWGPKYAYAFNEQFVRHHLGATAFPDTVMHLLVCHGGDPEGEDDLIDAFLDFGVGCYTGWTRNATLAHGDPAAVAFFEYLCGGYGRTVAQAIQHIESLGHSPDPATSAELVGYGDTALCLRALPQIIVRPKLRDLQLIRKLPHEAIEIVIDLGQEIDLPPWSVIGGKLAPVDEMGHRRFIPNQPLIRVLAAEDVMEEMVQVPVR